MITAWFTYSHVSVLVNNMYGKPLMNSVLDGTITKAMIGKMHGMKYVCKNICLSILKVNVMVVFLKKIEKITGWGDSKNMHHMDLTMKAMSD